MVTFESRGDFYKKYFVNRQLNTIAIYGIKELGERLYEELRDSDINVQYIIDKRQDVICENVPIYGPNNRLPEVDAIIVTASYYFDEIKKELQSKVNCPIISIENVVYTGI